MCSHIGTTTLADATSPLGLRNLCALGSIYRMAPPMFVIVKSMAWPVGVTSSGVGSNSGVNIQCLNTGILHSLSAIRYFLPPKSIRIKRSRFSQDDGNAPWGTEDGDSPVDAEQEIPAPSATGSFCICRCCKATTQDTTFP
jgi:hypothetical protein